jgi:hypothetical protein
MDPQAHYRSRPPEGEHALFGAALHWARSC